MRVILFSLLGILLTSCTTGFNGISVAESGGSFPGGFKTVEIQNEELPFFLGPIVVSNLAVAIAELGIEPVSADAEGIVTVRYVQIPIPLAPGTNSETNTEPVEGIGHSSETRFVARLEVELRQTETAPIIWQGSVERIHTVWPGSYMHTGPASPAILEAFRALLRGER